VADGALAWSRESFRGALARPMVVLAPTTWCEELLNAAVLPLSRLGDTAASSGGRGLPIVFLASTPSQTCGALGKDRPAAAESSPL
jgi:hypothetical protein